MRAKTTCMALAALGLMLVLAACANAVGPTPPVVAGGRGSLSRADDWGFGTRSQTRGFVFEHGSSA